MAKPDLVTPRLRSHTHVLGACTHGHTYKLTLHNSYMSTNSHVHTPCSLMTHTLAHTPKRPLQPCSRGGAGRLAADCRDLLNNGEFLHLGAGTACPQHSGGTSTGNTGVQEYRHLHVCESVHVWECEFVSVCCTWVCVKASMYVCCS